jgi:hypothetical protein
VAGYSGTPLAKKLGIKAETVLRAVNAPADYAALLAPLPENVTLAQNDAKDLDVVHLFTKTRSELIKLVDRYKSRIKQNGAIWVSWPKKSSGIPSEITEDTVREIALPQGLVDIKVCAVDDTWSGLKLVIRKENRK